MRSGFLLHRSGLTACLQSILFVMLSCSDGPILAEASASRHENGTPLPRGAAPSERERYVAGEGGVFICADQSGAFPMAAINDDFCDCTDGSDEPGTSACHFGHEDPAMAVLTHSCSACVTQKT